MYSVSLIGRIVRLFGVWYTTCSLCGVVTSVSSPIFSSYAGYVCCMACRPNRGAECQDDTRIRLVTVASRVVGRTTFPPNASCSGVERMRCRYCQCEVTLSRKVGTAASTVGHVVLAPHDVSGDNATLPPPLRRVAYCRLHSYTWAHEAHAVYDTNVVLAHIVHRARPVHAAAPQQLTETQEEDSGMRRTRAKRGGSKATASTRTRLVGKRRRC